MKHLRIILILIILTSLFFRTYETTERFAFAHDGDLYSWIVKDIVVDHHFRLIGQLTSAEGIFIGPLFYYLLIPFFIIFNMDPIGSPLLGALIGILTTLSFYYVFSKLFSKTAGIIAAFLHAILLSTIDFDRWIVPTLPSKLWTIWYFYALIQISRGNFRVLPLLGILMGLIWHIHIALLPTLIAAPVAFLISKKLPPRRQIVLFFSTLFITSLPLILFELRHNFLQLKSLIVNFLAPHAGEVGFQKLLMVVEMIAKNTNNLFFSPFSLNENFKLPFLITLLLSAFILIKYKIMRRSEAGVLGVWVTSVVLFFTFSSTLISEYYFVNLEIIFILFVSLLFTAFIRYSKSALFLALFLFGMILINNFLNFINMKPYQVGYLYRKNVADYIAADAKEKGYPCVGITYITKPGENVGFRYFFYLNKLHLIAPTIDVPVYNIVIPVEYSKEVEKRIGVIGIIHPTTIPSKETIQKSCDGPNTNTTDSLFGYVD